MGCLTVNTWDRTNCDVSIDAEGKNVSPNITAVCVQSGLDVDTVNGNAILAIWTQNLNSLPVITAGNRNSDVKIRIGLVCTVGNGTAVFYVKEGVFVVENGYFKVIT